MESFDNLKKEVKENINLGFEQGRGFYFEKAISLCDCLIEKYPSKEMEIRSLRGFSFGEKGKLESSIEDFNFILAKNPIHHFANMYLAKIYFENGKKDLAYIHLARSDGELFRGKVKKAFNGTIDKFFEETAKNYENLEIKEIYFGKFIL